MTIPAIPEGFILWAGGKCPVPDGAASVDVVTRGQGIFFNRPAAAFFWHHPLVNTDAEVIGYRVHPTPIDWQAHAEKAEAEIERRNGLFNVETVGQIVSALHTHNARVDAELATLRAKAEKLAEALADIARQKLFDELDEEEIEAASFEEGFGICIKVARSALAEWEGKP